MRTLHNGKVVWLAQILKVGYDLCSGFTILCLLRKPVKKVRKIPHFGGYPYLTGPFLGKHLKLKALVGVFN